MFKAYSGVTGSLLRRKFLTNQSPSFSAVFSTNNSSETSSLPTRDAILNRLQKGIEYDILIIGGGATGAGAALDAASRGLKVACVEREDFASGTSSRSTKLIWGGSRYLVQAMVALFSFDLRLLRSPVTTVKKFLSEFRMVLNCHRERRFLLEKQHHLTHWVPIAVPLTKWLLWPPPFNYPLAALGPLGIFPLFFKFYDALSGFAAPPSHVMTRRRAQRKFPQLATQHLKYCSVFYEGMHDDARTNLAIAQTAALCGADIANYCEVVALLKPHDLSTATTAAAGNSEKNGDDGKINKPVMEAKNVKSERIVGARVRDRVSGEEFVLRAKSVLLCGGPFTDSMRKLEDPAAREAVTGASGIHIVLPSYFAPRQFGLVDMSTSDGRFLFFLPWQGHVLVGTTDQKCAPTARPTPRETEIKWLLQEASKYLSADLKLRREDVLSAWSGIRPLATDPHDRPDPTSNTASASRDHVISLNPLTGVVFISGGKWTTYREMAEDAIDKLLETNPSLVSSRPTHRNSQTLHLPLIGQHGYHKNLAIQLIQDHHLSEAVAVRLMEAYGGRAKDVLALDETHKLLLPDFAILEAEVAFSVRYDWCVAAEDFLCRRSRLAFVHKDAAIRALPRVVEIMAQELHWDTTTAQARTRDCMDYLQQFGGPTPMSSGASPSSLVRSATFTEVREAFEKVDVDHQGLLSRVEVPLVCELLSRPLSDEEIDHLLCFAVKEFHNPLGLVSLPALYAWWNSEYFNPTLAQFKSESMASVRDVQGSGTMFG